MAMTVHVMTMLHQQKHHSKMFIHILNNVQHAWQ